MDNEKKELTKLRRAITQLTNQACKMHENGTSFVIDDRLHDYLQDLPLATWLEDTLCKVTFEIDHRIVELMK